MQKLLSRISFLILTMSLSAQTAGAVIKKISSNNVFEGEKIKLRGKQFRSKTNLTKVILVDGSGDQFGSDLTITSQNPKGFVVTMPSVASTKTLILRITGGNVDSEDPDDFPVVIFNAPDLSSPDPNPPDGNLNVADLLADSVIFENINLSGDTNGQLLWNGIALANKAGTLISDKILMNGVALAVNANGDLSWNSHEISKAAGTIQADSLVTSGGGAATKTGNGSFVFSSTNGTTTINASNGTNSLYLPTSGQLIGVLRGEFDFSVDGGTTGNKSLRNATLPIEARVTRAWYEVLTTLSSASDASSIAISIPTDDASGILASIAINDSSNPWDAGIHSCIQSGSTSLISEKTAAARTLQLNITGEALTAGKIVLFAEYVVLP